MVRPDLVAQQQGLITVAPVVSDPLFPVDHQRSDVELLQAPCDGEPRLPGSEHENVRVGERTGMISIRTAPTGALAGVKTRGHPGVPPSRPYAGWCTRDNTAALAQERYQEVMSTVAAADAGEAVGKDAAFEVLVKDLLHRPQEYGGRHPAPRGQPLTSPTPAPALDKQTGLRAPATPVPGHVAVKQSGGLFHEGGSVKKKRLSAFLAYPARKHARRLPPSIITVFLSSVLAFMQCVSRGKRNQCRNAALVVFGLSPAAKGCLAELDAVVPLVGTFRPDSPDIPY